MGLRGAVAFAPLCFALFAPGQLNRRFVAVSIIAGPLLVILGAFLLPPDIDPLFLGMGASLLICTDYRELADKVDAVLIALPHDLHYECGMYFAYEKKHILMEKPLCNTEEERLKLKEYLDNGEYGKVFMMSVWTEQLTQHNRDHWITTARLGWQNTYDQRQSRPGKPACHQSKFLFVRKQ